MFDYHRLQPNECDFIEVALLSELLDGRRLFLEIDDVSIVVFNIAGNIFAIADVCSHDDGPLGEGEVDGDEIVCPRHGARFNLRTGKALSLPAVVDIPAYPIQIKEQKILVGLPRG
jgi:3-phenylpropionate/trans-cinnamate dioxygenase ferredoxin subunit